MAEPRVAIVTGAARGIGAATALRLTADAIAAHGRTALAVSAHVSDADADLQRPILALSRGR